MKKLNKTTKSQINDFINQGQSIIDIINYLFTCDYNAVEIATALIKEYKCNETTIRGIFKHNYEIEFDRYIELTSNI